MEKNKKKLAINKIQDEIARIVDKKSRIMFYVLDTQGYPSGSLAYEYQLAKIAQDAGYDVSMLYQTDENQQDSEEFVGVGGWLGEEYANIKHFDIEKMTLMLDLLMCCLFLRFLHR